MKIIKLDAIDSTNSFLKELAQKSVLEDFTIVVTKAQRAGKGQMGNTWASEDGKNLTFSILKKLSNSKTKDQNYLNYAVCLALYEVFSALNVPKLSIKWPNDIMSANKKLCGVLIENSFQKNTIKQAIIGIGVNVNQTQYPQELAGATSIKNCINKTIDLNHLLEKTTHSLQKYLNLFEQESFSLLDQWYHDALYKKDMPTTFKDLNNTLFMGIIKGVSIHGKLQVQLEDDAIKEFGIKEISIA